MKTKTLSVALCAALACACAFAAEELRSASSAAIVRLLNSRAAGSPRDYADAAEIVAQDAAAGRPLQKFVIALFADDPRLPERVRLSAEKRKEYLDQSRGKIRALAEDRGNALAWYLISLEKNDIQALKCAANGGNVQALNALGTIQLTEALQNPNVDTNDLVSACEKGFACFKKAAEQGDANGLYNLGMCYMRGYGCAPDKSLALNCFRSGAEQGHPEAINNLGGFYRDGIVVEKNLESAARWFARSANLGNSYGQLNFALALQRGEGVEKDEPRAAAMLKDAAQQGNPEAMNAYGMCFHTGSGLDKDLAEAVKWFRASAARGFPPAMDNLSSCYDLGLGVVKDATEATVWKVRGMAARGDRNAAAWLNQNGHSLR